MIVEQGPHPPSAFGLEWPECVGIFVGGCVERGIGSSFRRQAHAHNFSAGEHRGWICVRSTRRVLADSGRPTTLLIHERAHLLTPNQGHTIAWAEMMRVLGRPAEAQRVRARWRVG